MDAAVEALDDLTFRDGEDCGRLDEAAEDLVGLRVVVSTHAAAIRR